MTHGSALRVRCVALAVLVGASTLAAGSAAAMQPADDGAARLARVRGSVALASERAEIDALARDASTFTDDANRLAAWMLAANAYIGRFDDGRAGRELLRRVADDPGADALTAAQAVNVLVRSDLDDDLVDDARADLDAHGAHVGAPLAALVRARLRRRTAHRLACAVVGVVAAAIAATIARSVARGGMASARGVVRDVGGVALGFGAVVAVGGGGLATLVTPGSAAPFVALGAAFVPLVVAARLWGALGAPGVGARIARGAACAGAAMASALLVLEGVDASYLATFGL